MQPTALPAAKECSKGSGRESLQSFSGVGLVSSQSFSLHEFKSQQDDIAFIFHYPAKCNKFLKPRHLMTASA